MSEFDDKPAEGISRRTVTKAMAWAVPVIAIAAPAPAFAVSGGILKFTGEGCKLPGNSQEPWNKGYAFKLTATNDTDQPITIELTSMTLGNIDLIATSGFQVINLDTCSPISTPFVLAPNTSYPNLALLTTGNDNSQNSQITVGYKANNVQQANASTTAGVAPVNGASCSAFNPTQKACIVNTIPGDVPAWQASHQYVVNDLVVVNGVELSCTTAGTSGASAPNVAGAVPGQLINDGSVVWIVVSVP